MPEGEEERVWTESYRREVRRGEGAAWEDEAARSKPMRTQEEVVDYRERVARWEAAILAEEVPDSGKPLDEDAMDKAMAKISNKARRELIRLHIQDAVLEWVLNTSSDDLVADTYRRVDRILPPHTLYDLEEMYHGEEPE